MPVQKKQLKRKRKLAQKTDLQKQNKRIAAKQNPVKRITKIMIAAVSASIVLADAALHHHH